MRPVISMESLEIVVQLHVANVMMATKGTDVKYAFLDITNSLVKMEL